MINNLKLFEHDRIQWGRVNIGLLSILLWSITMLVSQEVLATVDKGSVEGEHGVVRLWGALTEGACRLDMTSEYQEVDLGYTPNAGLRKVGDQSEPVIFHIKLRDCNVAGGAQNDHRLGSRAWDSAQPVVTVSFIAPADPDSPQLVKVDGISGAGLRLKDSDHQDVRLGDRGPPLFLMSGNNDLAYTVMLERTTAPLVLGSYWAAVNFRLNYD